MLKTSGIVLGALLLFAAGRPALAESVDYKALNEAKLSLTQAINTAEQQGDGKAIDAEFDVEDGVAMYEISILGADKLQKYKLDANTGQVRETENETIEKYFTRLKPEAVNSAKTTLAQAIGIAEQRVGGKAAEAEIDREGDTVGYEVKVAKADGTTQEVKVGADGHVGKVE